MAACFGSRAGEAAEGKKRKEEKRRRKQREEIMANVVNVLAFLLPIIRTVVARALFYERPLMCICAANCRFYGDFVPKRMQ